LGKKEAPVTMFEEIIPYYTEEVNDSPELKRIIKEIAMNAVKGFDSSPPSLSDTHLESLYQETISIYQHIKTGTDQFPGDMQAVDFLQLSLLDLCVDNPTEEMKDAWAKYCEKNPGWLRDTSYLNEDGNLITQLTKPPVALHIDKW
jgi:hypothetical protein